MLTTMIIDGAEKDIFALLRPNTKWTTIRVYGNTLDGRRAIVSSQTVPSELFTHGGKVMTGGHVYEYPVKAA